MAALDGAGVLQARTRGTGRFTDPSGWEVTSDRSKSVRWPVVECWSTAGFDERVAKLSLGSSQAAPKVAHLLGTFSGGRDVSNGGREV
jgi:hypothetical protein